MKQRVTYFFDPERREFDFDELLIEQYGIEVPHYIFGIREDRLTISPDEIPGDVSEALAGFGELHVKWIHPGSWRTMDPLSSRLPPGLHVFYSPLGSDGTKLRSVCVFVEKVFGNIKCTPELFTRLPKNRFSHSAAFYMYRPLFNIIPFNQFIQNKLATIDNEMLTTRIGDVSTAGWLDLDWAAVDQTLKLTALFPFKEQHAMIHKGDKYRTEAGIFFIDSTQPNLGSNELGVSGIIHVLNEQPKPSTTMFSIPSRHRQLKANFKAHFLQPQGLHPTMQLDISVTRPPLADSGCALHAYFTLPKIIFADRYQLGDESLLHANHVAAVKYMSEPVDLEQPTYASPPWGSTLLVELAPPADMQDGRFSAEIPLHLRYHKPDETGNFTTRIPYPVVFWACNAESGTKFVNNPFDRVNLGYDGLFGRRTSFWHLQPIPYDEALTLTAHVPVLGVKAGEEQWIGLVTAMVLLLGTGWVLKALWGAFRGNAIGSKAPTPDQGKTTSKKQQ